MSFLKRKEINLSKKSANERIDGFNAIRDDISEDQEAVLTIDDRGTIYDCNYPGVKLLDCLPGELIGKPVGSVLPELTDIKLFQETLSTPKLLFLSRIGHHFEVVCISGARFTGNLFFSDMKNSLGQHRLRVVICPVKQANA